MRILSLAVLLLSSANLSAHEAQSGWSYPTNCCSSLDCRLVDEKVILEGRAGYTVPSGEVVRHNDGRLRKSPDGEYHWCTRNGLNDSDTICLFVPTSST